MLLKAQSIAKSFGPVKVLKDVSLQVNEGDSIGLIGVNGAGKTTFIRILLRQMRPDTGELTGRSDRIGYLEQFAESGDVTVREVLGRPYGHIEAIKRRLDEIGEEMASGRDDLDWNALAEENSRLEARLAAADRDDEAMKANALRKVGLDPGVMERCMSSLSGGERTKVMLSRIVIQADDCDLLIMDEPTSHLDITTVEWLEDYLINSHCAVLVVSHDRYFLDKIATRMMEIDHGKSREYKGNYSDFITKKMLDLDRMEKEYRKYATQKKKQEEIAAQLHADQWYMTTFKTREKMIAKMEVKERPEKMQEVTVRIQSAPKSGKNVLIAKGLRVELGGRTILSGVDLDIQKGEKVGIFGGNGEGKSTLVRALLGEIPSEGELWVAPGARIGYYSQHHDMLDPKLTAEEQLLLIVGKERRAEARHMLARFLLFGDDVERPMSTLSGGQRARVALCTLLMDATNLLVLDEPTNYLDIPTKHAVEEALVEYDGTVITVTHDRYFLDTVCTKVVEVGGGTTREFAGTYSEMKGRPNVREIVLDADEYRVLAPFTNWATGRKYAKGERVLVTPPEQKNFDWAINQGKLKKTGGRQRKKVDRSYVDDQRSQQHVRHAVDPGAEELQHGAPPLLRDPVVPEHPESGFEYGSDRGQGAVHGVQIEPVQIGMEQAVGLSEVRVDSINPHADALCEAPAHERGAGIEHGCRPYPLQRLRIADEAVVPHVPVGVEHDMVYQIHPVHGSLYLHLLVRAESDVRIAIFPPIGLQVSDYARCGYEIGGCIHEVLADGAWETVRPHQVVMGAGYALPLHQHRRGDLIERFLIGGHIAGFNEVALPA